jgi:hypothetical protein
MYVRTREGNVPIGGSTMLGQPPASSKASHPVDNPVLVLTQVQRGKTIRRFDRKPSGFKAFFSDGVPSPQARLVITGKLMTEKNGVLRAITAADLKALQPKTIVNRAYAEQGVSAVTNYVSKIKLDGSFKTESWLVVDPGTRRIRVRVVLECKNGTVVSADGIVQCNGLDCFLALIDSFENRRPIGRVGGGCWIAGSHFEFLSSVRKMFQPAKGSSLTPIFDVVLHRNRRVCQLADVESAEGRELCSLRILNIGNNDIDIGHVLVGIEAHRQQKPNSQLPQPILSSQDAITEAFMTWAGDLGSALEPYAEAMVAGQAVDLKTYLNQKASIAELLGDIDGINIGAAYDDTKSLAENIRSYYSTRPFRRFSTYIARLKDDFGKPLIPLAQQKPPRISAAGRLSAASYISYFARAVATRRKVLDKLTQHQQYQFLSMLDAGSKEMNIVVDYFFSLIEGGLAKES